MFCLVFTTFGGQKDIEPALKPADAKGHGLDISTGFDARAR